MIVSPIFEGLFWISTGLVLYAYFGYPVVLIVLAGLKQVRSDLRFATGRRERRKGPGTAGVSPAFLPKVSVVFSAYNEEEVITEKMNNCASLDYPVDRVEVLVGCDGCSDRTAVLARAAAVPQARIFDFSDRSGKLKVLNRLLAEAQGEVVIFTDASTLLDRGAIRSLVRHFEDPEVGAVCGEMRLTPTGGRPRSESLHWRYEVFLKFFESRLNMLVGASGCVYAIRRDFFSPLPANAINEDFLIPMFIRARNHRVLYEPAAVGFEEETSMLQNFRRHVRIGAGNWHALRLTARLLSPTAGWICLSYWSHKVLRWLIPFLIPASAISALMLALEGRIFYGLCAAGAAGLAALAAVGHSMRKRHTHPAVFSVPYYFFSMNLALLFGFGRFLMGRQTATWERATQEKDS